MSGTAIELEVVRTAEIRMPYAYVYRPTGNPVSRVAGLVRPAGKSLLAPCLAFIVRHPDAGTILVDTGFHPDAIGDRRKDFGLPMSVMFSGLRTPDGSFDQQLRASGVEPESVERVVMTHLHVDHTSGMRLLPNARFTVSRAEWGAATGTGAGAKGFVGHHLPDESRVDLVEFKDEGEPHGPFSRTVDLLGDGSIRLVSTPGHTPGHLSLLLRVSGGRTVLLVGDAAYTLRNVREEILPLLTASDTAYRTSLREIAAFAEQRTGATLVPSHDPDAWRTLSP